MTNISKVLLISESFLHYRIELYNEFHKLFSKSNIELELLVNLKSKNVFENKDYKGDIDFKLYRSQFKIKALVKKLKEANADYVILFWNPYNITTWLLIFYLKLKHIPFASWTQGISMAQANNFIKKNIYKQLHNFSDSIILYSANELKYINTKNKEKTFVANNTINFNKIPNIELSKNDIKKKYMIPFENIVLFTGRIQKRKRLDILIDIFRKNMIDPTVGLVIVGPGMSYEYNLIINDSHNILYLGEINETTKINEIYKCSDIFCIPGTNGLGINHALYWGLPVIAFSTVWHNPEIYYLKDNINGFLVNNRDELINKINYLATDKKKLTEISENAKDLIRKEASVNKMFSGFYNAIEYLSKI